MSGQIDEEVFLTVEEVAARLRYAPQTDPQLDGQGRLQARRPLRETPRPCSVQVVRHALLGQRQQRESGLMAALPASPEARSASDIIRLEAGSASRAILDAARRPRSPC
jgi:hypothetical protein